MAGRRLLRRPRVPRSHHDESKQLSDIPRMSVWLKQQPDVEAKKKFLLFTDLYYTPTGEKIKEGFRYLDVDGDTLVAAFDSGDFEAVSSLPPLVDDNGEPDTGSVSVWLAYTKSGAFLYVQPVVDVDYVPTYPREPKKFTPRGDLYTAAREFDQSF